MVFLLRGMCTPSDRMRTERLNSQQVDSDVEEIVDGFERSKRPRHDEAGPSRRLTSQGTQGAGKIISPPCHL